MYRLPWLLIALSFTACGGQSSVPKLSVTCPGGSQLYGATSIDVLGDLVNGRPTMTFPDPVNRGKTGAISVEPGGNCRITPETGV
jgi:hypothetical protein